MHIKNGDCSRIEHSSLKYSIKLKLFPQIAQVY